jgi:NADPH:quinone reductase
VPASTGWGCSTRSIVTARPRDLRFLAESVAAGRLDTQIGDTRSWREAGEALEDLIERRVRGKAVLTID